MNLVKHLFNTADEYLAECKWTDLALIKICLCAIGVIIGLYVPKEKKKPVLGFTAILFTATYIPIVMKFFPMLISNFKTSDYRSKYL